MNQGSKIKKDLSIRWWAEYIIKGGNRGENDLLVVTRPNIFPKSHFVITSDSRYAFPFTSMSSSSSNTPHPNGCLANRTCS